MAQQQSVLGIFGLTPELYSQRRQDELEAEQLAVGKMSSGPGSLLNPSMANIYGLATQQGQMIGQGVKGLLGVEDPQMQMVRDVQAMRSQFDVSTPKGLREFAQALAPKYPELAMRAASEADKREVSLATVKQKSRESLPTPQTVAESNKLASLQSKYPDTLEGRAQAADEFAEWKSTFKQKEAAAGAPPGQKQIFEVEKDRAKKIQKELDSGYTVLERLTEQEAAIKNGVIGGSFADTRTKLATLGASLGIADPKLINALANTRSFKANELALGAAIAKQLGVNPTDKDFTASLDQFSRNSDDPRAALLFIEQLKDKFGKRVKINEDMMNVYLDPETGGSFRNYKGPKMIEPFTKTDELSQLLAEQARRQKKTKE